MIWTLFLILIALGFFALFCVKLRENKRLRELIRTLNDALARTAKEKDMIANHILAEQIDALHLLSEEYFKADEYHRQAEYYKAFRRQLAKLRDHDSTIPELEGQVNIFKDNAMALLRKEVPALSQFTFKLATLFFAGLPYESVSLLVQITPATLRTRKSLLRKAIIEADPLHKELFLACLDSDNVSVS